MRPTKSHLGVEKEISVSPKYQKKDWQKIDFATEEGWQKAIDIFVDRIEGRFLRMVDKIKDEQFAGFTVLAIDCLLIETLKQFFEGIENSETYVSPRYTNGANRVIKSEAAFRDFLGHDTEFSNYFIDEQNQTMARLFYKHFRCGILHQSEIKENALIKRSSRYKLVQRTHGSRSLIINRDAFHRLLEKVFWDYVERLRNPANLDLRNRFKLKMDNICRVIP